MMGATLANHGSNPVKGKQVIKPENIPHILNLNLYDSSPDLMK